MELLNYPVLNKPAFTAFVAVISSITIVCHIEGTLMLPELFSFIALQFIISHEAARQFPVMAKPL
jgi:hypothetical protein